MSIVKIIDDYVLEFGNQRFLEGWNGATEHIIKLLEDIVVDWRKNDLNNQADTFDYAIALIKRGK